MRDQHRALPRGVVLPVEEGIGAAWLGYRHGALEPWQPVAAQLGALVGALALVRAAGLAAPLLLDLARRRGPLRDGRGAVALASLAREPKRTAAMAGAAAVAVAVAVAMGVQLGSLVPGIQAGARNYAEEASGRLWVSTLPNNSAFVEAKLSPDDMDRLAAIDGVASADRRGWVDVDHPRAGNVTVDGASGPAPPYPVYEGDPAAEVLARGDAMIGPALARRLGLGPGDVLRLPGRHGFADLRVGGVWESPNNLGVMTLIEAGAIGAVGTVLGTVCAAGLQALTYLVSPILTGLQVPLRFDPTAPIVYGGLATVCVIAGSAWPAWRTSRVDSTTALRHE